MNTVSLVTLTHYLANLLAVQSIDDYCPNGLQVQGKSSIAKIVTGVTACQALLDAAIVEQADAILVHHGYFWKNEPTVVTGMKHKRISTLIKSDISLLAYHLPLDLHPVYGNNAQLAQLLEIEITGQFPVPGGLPLGFIGRLTQPMSGHALAKRLEQRLLRQPLHIATKKGELVTVAWCTGAAQNFIHLAAEQGCDAYISGEISEATMHSAREQSIDYYAAGHHATERYGVAALGNHLAHYFSIEHQFIDVDNPA